MRYRDNGSCPRYSILLALLACASAPAWGCSTHGTNAGNEIIWKYLGEPAGDGRALLVVGIEDRIVEPTRPTTCVTGIGLGSSERRLPAGIELTGARLDRVNRKTGEEQPLEAFRFAGDAETTTGMSTGGGSAAGAPRPIIDGATWFGFSSPVDPFIVGAGPDEYVRMTFEVSVPEALLPLLTDVQFAAGEGLADGTPIFTGAHPVQYYTGRDPLVGLRRFAINAGVSDAWYNPLTAGQGFFLIVWEDLRMVFLSWFTYDIERPPADVMARVGEPGHRWLTAQGPYSERRALLDVYVSSGGVFDSAEPAVGSPLADGTIEIDFANCRHGVVRYDLPSAGASGQIAIERIVADNVPLCEALSESPAQD